MIAAAVFIFLFYNVYESGI